MKPRRPSRASRKSGIDRRTFVQGAAAAAAPLLFGCTTSGTGAALGAPAVIRAPEKKLPPEVLKVGLIGAGGRGTGAAFNALRAEKGTVVLHAVADILPDRVDGCLKGLRESLGADADQLVRVTPDRSFTGFDSYKQLIDTDVDVVLLTTPPVFRPQTLAYAVEKGKHIFCEKPVAVDAPGIRSVLASVEKARAAGLVLVSGLCWRYHNRQRELFGRIVDGQIGDVETVYTTYNTGPNAYVQRKPGQSDMEYAIRNWYHYTWIGGDHVVEQAVHSIDKMAWCFKDVAPKSVVAVGGRSTPVQVGDRWDHFSATFDYGDGRKGFHMCRQWEGCANENHDYAYGTEGKATVRGWEPYQAIEGKRPWVCATPQNDMYQTEHDELFAAIRSGQPMNDGLRMTHSTLLAIMVRMAAYTGQVISWEQALNSQEVLGLPSYAFGELPARTPPVPGRTPFS
ncbi:MAG: Gfo/Idh/MocA family oxidoreductase [Planctomycetes bacterium]|nr:Gfo/Idh/MocA family oxidoreductase [Planctomycetota bacterium]